jgi:hypothetical protein
MASATTAAHIVMTGFDDGIHRSVDARRRGHHCATAGVTLVLFVTVAIGSAQGD